MTENRKHDAAKSAPAGRRADALDRLADALAEDVLETPGNELLAEVAQDHGDARALTREFDRIFTQVEQRHAMLDEPRKVEQPAAVGGQSRDRSDLRSAHAAPVARRKNVSGWVARLRDVWGRAKAGSLTPAVALARGVRMAPMLAGALLGMIGTVGYFLIFASPSTLDRAEGERLAKQFRQAEERIIQLPAAPQPEAGRSAPEARKIRTVTVRVLGPAGAPYAPLRYEPPPADLTRSLSAVRRPIAPTDDAFSLAPLPLSAYSRFVPNGRYAVEPGNPSPTGR
jgi:hypothetical protein